MPKTSQKQIEGFEIPVMGLMSSPATLVVAANQISSVMISLQTEVTGTAATVTGR